MELSGTVWMAANGGAGRRWSPLLGRHRTAEQMTECDGWMNGPCYVVVYQSTAI